jgi:hypothetical protein
MLQVFIAEIHTIYMYSALLLSRMDISGLFLGGVAGEVSFTLFLCYIPKLKYSLCILGEDKFQTAQSRMK